MPGFYEEMQAVASDVIAEFAQGSIAYVEITPGAGPADDPGAPTETVHPIDAVARGVAFKYVDRTTVVGSELQITMPGDGVEPSMNGFIRVDEKTYKIVKIIRKPSAGTVVAWTVIFRK